MTAATGREPLNFAERVVGVHVRTDADPATDPRRQEPGPATRRSLPHVAPPERCGRAAVRPVGPEPDPEAAGATLLTCLGMLTGGAAGSTTSGLKLIRTITLVEGTGWQIRDVFRPRSAVRHLRIGERRLGEQQAQREYTEATVVFILWLTFLAVGVAVFLSVLPSACPLEYVVSNVVSAQSNVGLDSGLTGPAMPDAAKAMLIVNMWVGRLEIIPVAVMV